jgi:glutamate synthase (ferredoxin)
VGYSLQDLVRKRTTEHIINFTFYAEELREIMAQLGFRTLKKWWDNLKRNVNKAIQA